jgi:hypothetical protein
MTTDQSFYQYRCAVLAGGRSRKIKFLRGADAT